VTQAVSAKKEEAKLGGKNFFRDILLALFLVKINDKKKCFKIYFDYYFTENV
jgi:hypothetical protein